MRNLGKGFVSPWKSFPVFPVSFSENFLQLHVTVTQGASLVFSMVRETVGTDLRRKTRGITSQNEKLYSSDYKLSCLGIFFGLREEGQLFKFIEVSILLRSTNYVYA